jgi:hypothetical protein
MSINLITEDEYDYDMGIVKTNQTLTHTDDEVNLFVDIDINKESSVNQLSKHDIYTGYKTVIVLYLNNISHDIKKLDIDKLTKENMTVDKIKSISYIRCSINILNNKYHKSQAKIVKNEFLKLMFSHDTFDINEIVIQLYEIPYDKIKLYVELYNNKTTYDDLKVNLEYADHYLSNYHYPIQTKLKQLLDSIEGVQYWKKESNCNINMSQSFETRDFRINNEDKFTAISTTTNNTNQKEVIESENESDLDKSPYSESTINKKHKYKSNTFIDPSHSIIHQPIKRTFYVTHHTSNINQEGMNYIFSKLKTEEEKYLLMNNLLVSKEYCHLLVNNATLLKTLEPIFTKYKHVFKYTFGYAWLTMYFEECLTKTFSKKENRHIFDIKTAHELPVFPYLLTDIKQNPYITLLVNNTDILDENCLPIKYINDTDFYGVCNIDTFNERLNMFMTHNKTKNIFDGLNWNKFGLSGSLIPACLQKKSPILDAFEVKHQNKDIGFIEYINHMYNSSDIDLMCNDISIFDFIKSVKNVYDIIIKNCNLMPNEIKVDTIKRVGITITKHFAIECIHEFNKLYSLNWTSEELYNNLNDDKVKYYMYNLYLVTKTQLNAKIISMNEIDMSTNIGRDYLTPINLDELNIYEKVDDIHDKYKQKDNDMIFRVNYFRNNETQVEENNNKIVMKINETFRYKIIPTNTTKLFKRPIEIFKTHQEDFFGTVSRFHYPCVRAYYQNNNVYMVPSCITSMMTMINIEYKYFSCIRDPIEIINKYIYRGFGLIMNKEEINKFKKFNTENNKFDNIQEILESKKVSSKLFKLQQFGIQDNNIYVSTKADLNTCYSTTGCPVDITRFTSIKENGCIRPYNQAYVKMMYDLEY